MIIELTPSGIDDRLYCKTDLEVNFYVQSYHKGVLTIEPIPGVSIENFASMVAALFWPSSPIYGLKRVKFKFNDIPISISDKKATKFMIVKQYYEKSNKLDSKGGK